MTRADLRRGLVLSGALTAALGALALAVEGVHAAIAVCLVSLPVGALAVGLAGVALGEHGGGRGGGRGARTPSSLGRQLSLVAVIGLGQMLALLGLFVGLMFVTSTEALLTALAALAAAVLAAWVARLLARRVMVNVSTVSGALHDLGRGERSVAIPELSSAELDGLGEAVTALAARLAEEERARWTAETAHRDLVVSVSHDLRTPITTLLLLCEALQDDVLDEDERGDYVRRIGVHVRALGGLVNDLFDLARLRADDVTVPRERVELDVLLEESVDAMRPQAEARSVRMRTELPPDALTAQLNPEQIQRVLFNLLQNAIRHTPSDGSIQVRAMTLPDTVQIEVADSGQGIPAQERERMFLPFVQGAERAARNGEGAGLGLAISRAIVEAHGGRIWLADADAGTRVRFTLPLAETR